MGMGQFPVAGQADWEDDWHDPRFGPPFHLHQGTDIFAERGTPVDRPRGRHRQLHRRRSGRPRRLRHHRRRHLLLLRPPQRLRRRRLQRGQRSSRAR